MIVKIGGGLCAKHIENIEKCKVKRMNYFTLKKCRPYLFLVHQFLGDI
jgi:hypothetical protein